MPGRDAAGVPLVSGIQNANERARVEQDVATGQISLPPVPLPNHPRRRIRGDRARVQAHRPDIRSAPLLHGRSCPGRGFLGQIPLQSLANQLRLGHAASARRAGQRTGERSREAERRLVRHVMQRSILALHQQDHAPIRPRSFTPVAPGTPPSVVAKGRDGIHACRGSTRVDQQAGARTNRMPRRDADRRSAQENPALLTRQWRWRCGSQPCRLGHARERLLALHPRPARRLSASRDAPGRAVALAWARAPRQ